jgi:hypothetical protein
VVAGIGEHGHIVGRVIEASRGHVRLRTLEGIVKMKPQLLRLVYEDSDEYAEFEEAEITLISSDDHVVKLDESEEPNDITFSQKPDENAENQIIDVSIKINKISSSASQTDVDGYHMAEEEADIELDNLLEFDDFDDLQVDYEQLFHDLGDNENSSFPTKDNVNQTSASNSNMNRLQKRQLRPIRRLDGESLKRFMAAQSSRKERLGVKCNKSQKPSESNHTSSDSRPSADKTVVLTDDTNCAKAVDSRPQIEQRLVTVLTADGETITVVDQRDSQHEDIDDIVSQEVYCNDAQCNINTMIEAIGGPDPSHRHSGDHGSRSKQLPSYSYSSTHPEFMMNSFSKRLHDLALSENVVDPRLSKIQIGLDNQATQHLGIIRDSVAS